MYNPCANQESKLTKPESFSPEVGRDSYAEIRRQTRGEQGRIDWHLLGDKQISWKDTQRQDTACLSLSLSE